MKRITKKILLWSVMLMSSLMFLSCADLDKVIVNENVEANVLNSLSAESYELTFDDRDEIAETFSWTIPDFGFQAGVLYRVEVDLAGNSFGNAFTIAETRSQSASVTVGLLNNALLAIGAPALEAADFEFRVVSTISNNVQPVVSNIRSAEIVTYVTSFPSIWGMGAGLKGWGPWPDNAVEWPSNQFKKYSQIAYFTQGEAFRFFEQLDWGPTSYNYPFFSSVSNVFENANDGDSNFRVAATSGWYLVNIDLIGGTVTAEATSEPIMYMTGAGIGGWDQPGTGASVLMTFLRPGVFMATANFVNNEAFRFFAQPNWGPTSYNYPYFTTVDPLFINANDGDSNLRYVGSSGPQTVIVDIEAKTVVVVPPLYMMGAALNGWGPWPDNAVKMTYLSSGVYQATATFTNGEAFRFFAQADWGPTSFNFPYFTSVASDFANASDGDSNFRYVGTTGSRTVRVNLETKVVTLVN
ncbi:MAG: SusE domain-containing protein [Cyclobacteriaceae bacterium]|nr:SusE domain-containing protein [Cyclobacteriaceae bacterium]